MMKFYKAPLPESFEAVTNPGIGWYHIYTWRIAPPYPEFFYVAEEKEVLVLLLMDIGAFCSEALPDEAVFCIGRILEFYHTNKKQMILRFVYDTQGSGMLKEPSDIELVKTHMRQVGGVVQKYENSIACIQGIFVGSWGEMHSSRYLSDKAMTELIETLDEAVGEKCFLAVRKPSQWRIIEKSASGRRSMLQRMGLFNDGIFGSETDLGSYLEMGRKQELDFLQERLSHTCNGGEALAGETLTGYARAAHDFEKMHISYLNSVYQKELLDYWRSEKAKIRGIYNISGYDYIGLRLGYRFVIRSAKLNKQNVFCVKIENIGFANLCREAVCCLLIENASGRRKYVPIETDARLWDSKKNVLISADLSGLQDFAMHCGKCSISISLRLKSRGEVIRFANKGAADECFLGKLEI